MNFFLAACQGAGLAVAAGAIAGAWPGWPLGARIAWLSFAVVSDFATGAAARADGGGFIGAVIVLAALATAGLSVILPPLGLVAVLGIAYLGVARRGRASRKYEGLRSLR